MSGRILLVSLLSIGLIQSVAAIEQRYAARLDESRWTLVANDRIQCRLEHVIPGFGRILVDQASGRPLSLALESGRQFARGINVELRSEKPSWSGSAAPLVLGRLEMDGRRGPLRVAGVMADSLLNELRAGNQPGFLFYTDNPLMVSLSSVGFAPALGEFERCVGGLYRDNFEDVRLSNIYFDPDQEFASLEQEEKAFRRMLDYLAEDDSIVEIIVTGHADSRGLACYNEGLSSRRANYVYELLLSLGVAPELMRIDYVGESLPRKRGSSKQSHAANRRVSVELRRN